MYSDIIRQPLSGIIRKCLLRQAAKNALCHGEDKTQVFFLVRLCFCWKST